MLKKIVYNYWEDRFIVTGMVNESLSVQERKKLFFTAEQVNWNTNIDLVSLRTN